MSTPSSSSSQPRTYYTLLGIDQDATPKEIEKAYKRQALIHHPDRNPNESQTQSTNKFQKLAEAYEILRDPIKRRKYDLKVANTIALNSDTLSAHQRPSAPANVYPNRPASQQSGRPSSQPKRSSSTFDLFAYPGETPQYVPSPSRRPASTAPAFRTRPGSSAAQPTPPPSMSATTPNPPRPPTHRHSLAAHPQPHHHAQSAHHHQPFTQRINLKDLDSLDFILNMGLNPQARQNRPSNVSPSSAIRSQPHASLDSDSPPFHPTHSRNMSSSAPDPYLTFERAWGHSLDEIVDRVPDLGTDRRKYSTRKSNTDPSLMSHKPRNVQRSATVRSADSDYRASASNLDSHSHHRRPRSAGSDAFRDWLPTPNCTSPISTTTRPSKESRLSLDDDTFYLPSATYQSQARRMSTGNEKLYQPSPPPHQATARLYQPSSGSAAGLARGNGGCVRGSVGGGRGSSSSSSTMSPGTPSADYPTAPPPGSSSSHPLHAHHLPHHHHHHHHHPSRRSRATTMMPEYPAEKSAGSQGLSREFREVIIRFERERDGSTRLSKEFKSRTVDLDGTVHDRYRRQRAAAVN
ncbi:hypothetical protein PCASD_13836 [Puccinia coronata f. sp. avenae]|uniref:J domain-containing protein n=1 Tax=Puccinia coronata f. sp. avenae TaxID=200324 RepID=A0A2N5T347_9BASI|nr:hypothetical protein PCASD_13836 [Puccinia coronata f. sp. avenae]